MISGLSVDGARRTRWPLISLGELGRYINGRAFKPEEWANVGLPIIRIENLNSSSAPYNFYSGEVSDLHRVVSGDLLISWSASLDAYLWNRGPAVLNQHIFKVLNDASVVRRDFLFYAVKWAMRDIRTKVHGATMTHITKRQFQAIKIPLPPLGEQKQVAAILNQQISTANQVLQDGERQRDSLSRLATALLRGSLTGEEPETVPLTACLREVNSGVGASWNTYPVLGATRAGLAPAKEPVGKRPEKYKLVDMGTIFYNPMRILIGSIALVDEGNSPGITSPDYVVFKCDPSRIHYRWFYHWLRSPFGQQFIRGLARGAVRERLLFKRLAGAAIKLPSIDAQKRVAERLPEIDAVLRKIDEQIALAEKLPLAYLDRLFVAPTGRMDSL